MIMYVIERLFDILKWVIIGYFVRVSYDASKRLYVYEKLKRRKNKNERIGSTEKPESSK